MEAGTAVLDLEAKGLVGPMQGMGKRNECKHLQSNDKSLLVTAVENLLFIGVVL